MKRLILMLEDESERLVRFKSVLAAFTDSIELQHWRTADAFIDGYKSVKQAPSLLCLDHDLFTDHPEDPDPGDGREVARFLAKENPCCHAIIHSSNAPAADSMYFTMLEAGWSVERIAPLGKDWIESYWWDTAKPWLGFAE